jgi:methyltransferase-like protein
VNNRPIYFHEFARLAAARGLQYLAEAELSLMLLKNLPAKTQEALRNLPILELEQYMDFVRGRKFRKTLLCHAKVPLQRSLKPDVMRKLHFGLNRPLQCAAVDIRDDSPAEFRLGGGVLRFSTRIGKAAMVYLNEIYPRCASFRELCAVALARTRVAGGGDQTPQAFENEIGTALLAGCTAEFFAISVHPPHCVCKVSQHPQVQPLARIQAGHGCQLANLRHQPVELNPLASRIVQRLDGRHDMRSLVSYVREALREEKIEVKRHDRVVEAPDAAILTQILDNSLSQIAASALLVG